MSSLQVSSHIGTSVETQKTSPRSGTLKCLTVQQPWAHLSLSHEKRIENRLYATQHRGPLLIHASRAELDVKLLRLHMELEGRKELAGILKEIEATFAFHRGAIVGCVDLIWCTRARAQAVHMADQVHFKLKYSQNVFANQATHAATYWVYGSVFKFATPIPYRGMPGMFEVPDEAVAEEMRACGATRFFEHAREVVMGVKSAGPVAAAGSVH